MIEKNTTESKAGISGEEFTKAKIEGDEKKIKKETRGRPKKAEVEKQKIAEAAKAREFGAAILPKALESIEFMTIGRIPDEDLRERLKLKTEEKQGFSEAFLAVAEKHGWLNPSDMPELTLLVVTASIILPRIGTIREYANAKKYDKKPDPKKRTDSEPKGNTISTN